MEKRIGFVGIIISDRARSAPLVNAVLSEFGALIAGRMGLPCETAGVNIITLIVRTDTDGLGALTGKLGEVPGVTVKSALAPVPPEAACPKSQHRP